MFTDDRITTETIRSVFADEITARGGAASDAPRNFGNSARPRKLAAV